MVKNISELIIRKRVVLNEELVYEFALASATALTAATLAVTEANSNGTTTTGSTLSPSSASTLAKKNTHKRSDSLGISPRASKLTSAAATTNPNLYQPLQLATSLTSNPYFGNRFPVSRLFSSVLSCFHFNLFHLLVFIKTWSYTHAPTGCSLIIAPSANSSSRQDDSDLILKKLVVFISLLF